MHHDDDNGTKMRSCSSADESAVLPLAILSATTLAANDHRPARAITHPIRISLESLSTPPLTPPPRHA